MTNAPRPRISNSSMCHTSLISACSAGANMFPPTHTHTQVNDYGAHSHTHSVSLSQYYLGIAAAEDRGATLDND